MARYDKYDPISGGFRAPLAADLTPNASGEWGPRAVSLEDRAGQPAAFVDACGAGCRMPSSAATCWRVLL